VAFACTEIGTLSKKTVMFSKQKIYITHIGVHIIQDNLWVLEARLVFDNSFGAIIDKW
jgi:hypothetical protein